MAGFSNPLAPKPSGSYMGFISRIRAWTRDALAVDPAILISVNELACPEAGCPPRETVIIVMTDASSPRRARIHKAMADVTDDDVRHAFSTIDA
jgi:hypothetical protein